jgi:uncharacterized protein
MATRAAGIGLISDTHGLLRPEALIALQGSELIIHAGDVGKPEVVEALKTIAPVIAVRGNVDTGAWAAALPATSIIEARSAKIYVIHDLHELNLDLGAAGINIVVSGHSHKPRRKDVSGVLYVNPGSAGPRRFRLPVSVARLNLGLKPWKIDFINL